MEDFYQKDGFAHYLGCVPLVTRNVFDCMETLEHRHYKPGTPENAKFVLAMQVWFGNTWVIASIPEQDQPWMKTAAAVSGLKVLNSIPAVKTGTGIVRFPIDAKLVFMLQNK